MNRRTFYAIGIVVLLGVAAAAGYTLLDGRAAAADFRLAKVERGTITAAVSATGTVNPVTAVSVGSQVSGQIKELLVDFNSEVKKGQVIARIDPEAFNLKVSQAMADVEASRASVLSQRANVIALQAEAARAKFSLGEAERELQRNKGLFEKNFVSAAALDKAQAGFEVAREQLKTAQAQADAGSAQVRNVEALVRQRESQLAQARVDLERTTIRAPVDGTVVKKSVEPGQTVAASLQAPELFVIAQDLREMQVETSIDEAEVGRVQVGQAATFTVDSFPGRVFNGKVSQVRKAATVVQNVVTYTAIIATTNPDLRLFPGMTANVRIVVDTRENVLKMPNSALRFRPAGATAEARETIVAGEQPAGAPAPSEDGKGAGKGAGKGRGGGGEAMRERLVKELGLNAEQQTRLEAIMKDTRDKMRGLDTEDKGERRKQSEAARAEQRARIAEMLTPEQRKRYEEMNAATRAGSGRQVTSGRVWTTGPDGKPKGVNVRTGLTDGTYSELVSGDLPEGAQVIVGTVDAGKAKAQPKGGPRFAF
jgi:HlyD family secretion protein